MDLLQDAVDFKRRKQAESRSAAQRVALLCNCGIDVDEIAAPDAAMRDRLAVRLRRLIERERIRGSNRHWSYDLNRHIALKQALDWLGGSPIIGPEMRTAPRRRRRR